MRIIYLHQYFTLPSQPGSTRSYEFVRRWIAHGKDVRVITSSYNLPSEFQNLERPIQILLEGIPTTIIPTKYSQNMTYLERMREFMRFGLQSSRVIVRQRADIIYATSTPLTIAVPAIIGKYVHRIPMVLEVRDLWPEVPIAMGALRNPILRRMAQILEWSAYHAASHVVTLAPNMADGVIKRGIAAKNVSVVPNASDVDLFAIDDPLKDDFVRKRLGIAGNQQLVVYTGAFGHVNGVSYLVDVAYYMQYIMPDVCFLLIGGGVERPMIIQRASEKNILDQSLWIWDPVPKAQMPSILASATIATSTVIFKQELWNNSANKFFDALASGTPLAINHGGWLADLLVHSGAGIILSPNNPEAGAYELATFLHDPIALDRAKHAAANLAREHFDRDKLSLQVENILESVLNSRYRARS